MSKNENAAVEETTAKTAKKKAERKNGPMVYCGPSVRGVARQYTVFIGGVPERITEFIKKHPAAANLLVSADRFAEMRKRLETAGTAESIIYQKIKAEL